MSPFKTLQAAISISLVLFAQSALAANKAPAAMVDAVQMPAWLERNGQLAPLVVGTPVKDGDHIRTGTDARVYLKLAEGSTVKLGENGDFAFYSKSLRPASFLRGALDVVTGAFRFTTGLISKQKQRNLSIRVGTSTIGIRGTDLWGRASKAEDMAVLLEGKIEISRGDESVILNEPLTQYRAIKGGEIASLTKIDTATVANLARETEIQPGAGAVRKHGRWKLLFDAVASESEALELYDNLRAAGYHARIRVSKAANTLRYTVYLPSLANATEAKALGQRVKAQLNIDAKAGK